MKLTTLNFFGAFRNFAPLFLRVPLGYAFFWAHGWGDKLAPNGFDGGKAWVADHGDIAAAWMLYAAAWTEFLAGAALLLGLLTRWASIALLGVMGYAIFKVHASDPYGVKELAIAYAGALSALLLIGPGTLSLDKMMLERNGG